MCLATIVSPAFDAAFETFSAICQFPDSQKIKK